MVRFTPQPLYSSESPVTNFIGDGIGPRFCLNASGLKMEETGCSETTITTYELFSAVISSHI